MNSFLKISTIFLVAISFAQVEAQVHKGISFQGVIKLPSGEYPTRSGVTVNARILSPSNCILREEQFTGVNLSNGYINLAIGTGATGGDDPGLSLSQVMNNSKVISHGPSRPSGLACLNVDGSINGAVTSFDPSTGSGARKFRLSLMIDSIPVVADFNMRSMAYAINAETLNGKVETDFINTSANVTQSSLESWFSSTVMGQLVNGTYNAPTATSANSVTGTVAIANGGTGATTASGARTSLGLGTLATLSPMGTADGTTFLRGDGVWATVSGSGSESDPTVQSFAKNAPSTGLSVVGDQLTVSYGSAAGTAAQGNDSRITGAHQTSTALSGDLSGTLPNPTVAGVKGQSISAAGTSEGQVLRYVGSNTWTPGFVRMEDVRSTVGGHQMIPTTPCTASQVMMWSAVTDRFACGTLGAGVLTAGTLPVGRLPAFTGGDVTSSAGSVALVIGNSTVTAAKIVDGAVTAAKLDSGVSAKLPGATCGSGNKSRWNGTAWVCEADVTDVLWTESSGDVYRGSGSVGIGTVPTATLDVAGSAKISGSLDMSSQKITNVAPPTAAADVATKAYVDAATGGRNWVPMKVSFTTEGSHTWTVPNGVTSIMVDIWGGGMGGHYSAGGCSGGGSGNGSAGSNSSVKRGGVSLIVAGGGGGGSSSGTEAWLMKSSNMLGTSAGNVCTTVPGVTNPSFPVPLLGNMEIPGFGKGGTSGFSTQSGYSGKYARGIYPVTPGETLDLIVGAGGAKASEGSGLSNGSPGAIIIWY